MSIIADYMVLLIPLAIIQLGLLIAALVHILKHETYKTGSRVLWIVLCIVLNLIGPILYFCIGASYEKKGE